MTLNDKGHLSVARLFKCNSTNICATFEHFARFQLTQHVVVRLSAEAINQSIDQSIIKQLTNRNR